MLGVKTLLGCQQLHHAAHRVRAIERTRRPAQQLDAIQAQRIHQRDVLAGGISEHGIVQAHAVHQVQHFGTLEPAHDHHALARAGGLIEGAGLAAQGISPGLWRSGLDFLAADHGDALRSFAASLHAFAGGDLEGIELGCRIRGRVCSQRGCCEQQQQAVAGSNWCLVHRCDSGGSACCSGTGHMEKPRQFAVGACSRKAGLLSAAGFAYEQPRDSAA